MDIGLASYKHRLLIPDITNVHDPMGHFFAASWWLPHCCAVWMQEMEILFFYHSYERDWRGEGWKTIGHHPEDLLLGELHGLFLVSRPHPFPCFGPEVSLFRSQQGHNTPYLTFSLPFLGLTTLLSCISRFPETLSIITYLGLFLHTLGLLRHDSHLSPVWDCTITIACLSLL